MYELYGVAISNTDNTASDGIMTKRYHLILIKFMKEIIPVGTEKLSLR
jgi:hypothetical protein